MWKRFLSSRWCVAIAALLGVLLASPSLHSGLVADDFFHWQILTGHLDNAHSGSLWGLFSFANGDSERTHDLMRQGIFPWWTVDTLRLSFWRPLSELTHWIDYRWWPDSPLLMHAQSLAWYAALIGVLGVWLRAIDANKMRAGLATLIYAISAMHGTVVGWIANRNALIAAFFALVCLIGFHYARQSTTATRKRYALLLFSLLAFGLSLLSGESAIATAPYLFAYVVFLDKRGTLFSRLLSLLPYAALAIVWKLTYSHFGYGSFGSGAYIDPAAEAGKFLPTAALRLPALLAAQFFGVPALLYNFMESPFARITYSLVAVLAVLLFGFALRAMQLHREKIVQFFAVAMVLALIPVCATAPDDRLLTFAGFGGAGLLSAFICEVMRRLRATGEGTRVSVGIKILAGYVVLLHLIVMPALLPNNSTAMATTMAPYLEQPAIGFAEQDLTPNTRLILINPPLPSCISYLPFVRRYHRLTPVKSAMALASGSRRMTVSVIDAHTLRIDVPEGFISPLDSFFRDPQYGFAENQTIDLGEIRVTVEQVAADGQAVRARFEFVNSLRAADTQFYVWSKGEYRRITLPFAGGHFDIDAFDFQHADKETVNGI